MGTDVVITSASVQGEGRPEGRAFVRHPMALVTVKTMHGKRSSFHCADVEQQWMNKSTIGAPRLYVQ